MARPKAYPVKKVIGLDLDMAERIRSFRFDHRINTENEAIRRLIEAGLKANRGSHSGGGSDQAAETSASKPAPPKPRAKPAAMSKEAQIRALRERSG